MDEPLNLVLFSGTDDKLQAAVGPHGRRRRARPAGQRLPPVLGARRLPDGPDRPRPRARPRGRRRGPRATSTRSATAGQASWADTLRQAKELGAIDIEACSLSMDLLGIEQADLDPLVDGVEGVTAFYLNAGEGQVVFI